MENHRGRIVELHVRRQGYNITSLSKSLNVSRRSVYRWLSQANLTPDIIRQIGIAISHDFSVEFPNFINSEKFDIVSVKPSLTDTDDRSSEDENWKFKYIALLEKMNRELQDF